MCSPLSGRYGAIEMTAILIVIINVKNGYSYCYYQCQEQSRLSHSRTLHEAMRLRTAVVVADMIHLQ